MMEIDYLHRGGTLMSMQRNTRWIAVALGVLIVVGVAAWGVSRVVGPRKLPTPANAMPKGSSQDDDGQDEDPRDAKIPVKVVLPRKGELQRLSTQPGSIQAYESVRLFAKVPGFLKKQKVDIGDTVKKGQVLAVVDVPELEAQLRRNTAGVEQAKSKVQQMDARVKSSVADLKAAKAAVTRAEASEKAAGAWVRFRFLQLRRMEALFAKVAIEEKLVDEAKEHYETSVETELAAKETITASKANVEASDAKIDIAKADVKAAQAEVDVTQAELEKTRVQVAFATITAPFDGVITSRSFFENDFVRAANDGGNIEPLLTVNRTDLFRVVVLIPDRDVSATDVGDGAELEIDSLPGKKFQGKVSRFASALDPQTRLMRVEIDLPNPTGSIKAGMYGQVTIVLDQERNLWSVPFSCLLAQNGEHKPPVPTGNIRFDFPTKQAPKAPGDEAAVFVVRDGHVKLVQVRLGMNNGLRAAVLSGLTAEDRVVLNPNPSLTDGAEVTPTLWDEMSGKALEGP